MLNEIKLLCNHKKNNSDDGRKVSDEVQQAYLRILSFLVDFFAHTAVLGMALYFSSLFVEIDNLGTRHVGFNEEIYPGIQYILLPIIFVTALGCVAIMFMFDEHKLLGENRARPKIGRVLIILFAVFMFLSIISAYITPVKYALLVTFVLSALSVYLAWWKSTFISL